MKLVTAPIAAVSLLLFLSVPLAATEAKIWFRFELDKGAIADVSDTADLVRFLKEDVLIDAGTSVESYLWVNVRGYIGDPSVRSPDHFWSPYLRVALNGNGSVAGVPWAVAVRESHGDPVPDDGDAWDEQRGADWTEDEAWGQLVAAIDANLPNFAAGFGKKREEHLEFRLLDVEMRRFMRTDTDDLDLVQCCYSDHGVEGPAILLKPDLVWDDSSFPVSEGLPVETDVLILYLEPPAPSDSPIPTAEEKTARKMADEVCSMRAPTGMAKVSLGELTLHGTAAHYQGPDGQLLIVMGGEEAEDWCLLVGSTQPLEGGGGFNVVDPVKMNGDAGPLTAVLRRSGEAPVLFWSTSGQVTLSEGPALKGQLELEGVLVGGDGYPLAMELRGMFEAVTP